MVPVVDEGLERAGHTVLAVLAGGPADWSDVTGRAPEAGT